VFTSSTCEACDGVLSRARPLESSEVAVVEVEANADREVHDRYGIDAVPLVLVVDDEGAVRHHHLGPVTSTHLWASLAEVRQPGSVPDGCSAS
jgi:thioredoxin-like negative regulator of GroEL